MLITHFGFFCIQMAYALAMSNLPVETTTHWVKRGFFRPLLAPSLVFFGVVTIDEPRHRFYNVEELAIIAVLTIASLIAFNVAGVWFINTLLQLVHTIPMEKCA